MLLALGKTCAYTLPATVTQSPSCAATSVRGSPS